MKKATVRSAASLVACGMMVFAPAAAQPVATASGPLEGVKEGTVTVFRGVPFAAPPIGPMHGSRTDLRPSVLRPALIPRNRRPSR